MKTYRLNHDLVTKTLTVHKVGCSDGRCQVRDKREGDGYWSECDTHDEILERAIKEDLDILWCRASKCGCQPPR